MNVNSRKRNIRNVKSWTEPITGMDFIWVSAGSFWMGAQQSDADATWVEMPRHKVTLTREYWIGKYPVTQFQWKRIMGRNPSFFKGVSLPVERVSWEDCQEFLAKLNRRSSGQFFSLPTEAQWEYACRAGTQTRYSWGDESDCEKANYGKFEVSFELLFYDCGGQNPGRTSPVGKYPPNAWEICDMHGNVWEWCEDTFEEYSTRELVDPVYSGGTDRVCRGGGWGSSQSAVRSSFRDWAECDQRSADLGFRIVFR
ncbi:formylglycine-generating enzyme family protein [Desulfomicrobium baculatum]|uniref:Sulfatase-modifying factor enzyme-like domain-containing protein n=1 Tax=Desulfomicrobium baculatum (strain DSM 4028 / VKM B-1378 / X) TaxID=525897 RepID=C7LRY2_DESBD|nr:formylglycine-generating enzyme family protein [Desulfomicrobium baculatum]ACU89365.1 protein of unknown function DUF323 [Desulfomicrobium baculatum DSM 4028]